MFLYFHATFYKMSSDLQFTNFFIDMSTIEVLILVYLL